MDGILLIDKPKGITSRDVVNQVIKKLNIKKVGHTGTLDPLATGVMVVCIGKATKLVDLLTSEDKEYVAEVTLGIETDTMDITGKVLNKKHIDIKKENIIKSLKKFLGKYNQEVPIYSAVKINGKKLYEYARNNETMSLPKREVEIKNIELLNLWNENDTVKFSFSCLVSKGTYIRSLIKDICNNLNVIGTMSNLRRIKQGKFNISQCRSIDKVSIDDIKNIKDIINIPIISVDNYLKNKILNGQILENRYNVDTMLFVDEDNKELAIYKTYLKDRTKIKPFRTLFHK